MQNSTLALKDNQRHTIIAPQQGNNFSSGDINAAPRQPIAAHVWHSPAKHMAQLPTYDLPNNA
ncbi:hypothetical protein TUM4630_24320 [Shewanella algidipiscicola]|uniref:Uncharacterized protein n=1 Tax=Shewanella algidipiscicola TaxID=614070 RepID=A0ABQ4PKA1_9GAMM|nr:hypothetical protein TUM4630_24320 [Shewanella algidipiscicola]